LSGTLSEDAPILEDVDVKYECYEDIDKTQPSNTLSVDGKYTPTADGASRYVWFTVSAGEYYYSSGVYHPKTTAETSTIIKGIEAVKPESVNDCTKEYNLNGQIVKNDYNGVVIANGSKILRK
jgi:hypothetical protein